ncbi:MAG: DUF1415 domain-containing protein [Leptolyngbyaceae bacterium]|nr:DUF1415 domain-containing protein [Leptolyngbyaceae bacterium]
MKDSSVDIQAISAVIQQWLENVVIGLNLCPFAASPHRNRQIRIQVSTAQTQEALLKDLVAELRRLDRCSPEELETTLLVTPILLTDFEDYNEFLGEVDELLHQFGWEGEYQVASFHPHYQFADTSSDDAGNLTNRSPYPIFHILREASISKALASYPNPETIPETNIQTVCQLSKHQIKELFPFLSG